MTMAPPLAILVASCVALVHGQICIHEGTKACYGFHADSIPICREQIAPVNNNSPKAPTCPAPTVVNNILTLPPNPTPGCKIHAESHIDKHGVAVWTTNNHPFVIPGSGHEINVLRVEGGTIPDLIYDADNKVWTWIKPFNRNKVSHPIATSVHSSIMEKIRSISNSCFRSGYMVGRISLQGQVYGLLPSAKLQAHMENAMDTCSISKEELDRLDGMYIPRSR